MTDPIGKTAAWLYAATLAELKTEPTGLVHVSFITTEVKNREMAYAVRQRLYETTDIQHQVWVEPKHAHSPHLHWKLKVKPIWAWKRGFEANRLYEHKTYHGTWKLLTTDPTYRFVQGGKASGHVITLEHPEQQFYDRQLGSFPKFIQKEEPERDLSPKRNSQTKEKSDEHLQAYEKLKAEAEERSNRRRLQTGSRYVVCPHCLSVNRPYEIPWIHPHQVDWDIKEYVCEESLYTEAPPEQTPAEPVSS